MRERYKSLKKIYVLRSLTLILIGVVLVSCGKQTLSELKSSATPVQAVTRISFEFENTEQALTGTPDQTSTNEGTDIPVQNQQVTSTAMKTSSPGVEDTVQPTLTITQTPTAPVSRTPTRTPTLTRTPITPTATQASGWGGEWVVYYQDSAKPEKWQQGTLVVELAGKQIDAVAEIGGLSFHLIGVISDDEQRVNGNYTQGSENGWFYWATVSVRQFGGTLGNRFAFCASRNINDRPDKCFIGVPS